MNGACPCGARWSGFRAEHCLACHCTFSGTTAGDLHRTGDHAVSSGPNRRRCRTADEMLAKGLEPKENGFGTPIWGKRMGEIMPPWLSRQTAEGPAGPEWAPVPPRTNGAVTEMESA